MGALDRIGNALGNVADGARRAAGELGEGAQRAAGAAWNGAVQAGHAAASGAHRAASEVAGGVGRGVQHLAEGVRQGDVLGGLQRAQQDVAAGAGRGLEQAWHGATGAVGQAYRGGVAATREAGAGVGNAYGAAVDGVARGVSEVAGPAAGDAVRTAAQAAAEPVRQVAQFNFGVAQGVAEGAGALVSGAGDLVVGGVRVGTDAEYRDRMVQQAETLAGRAGQALSSAAHDPAGAARAVGNTVGRAVDGFVQEGAQAVREGRGAEFAGQAVGRVGFEIAATVVPPARIAGAAGMAGRAAERAVTAGRVLDGASDAGRLARAGDAAADAARGTARVLDEAAPALRGAAEPGGVHVLEAPRGIGGIELPRTPGLATHSTMADLLRLDAVPGRPGVILTETVARPSDLYGDVYRLSNRNGVEYALTREEGNLVLRSGAPDTVGIPRNAEPLAHTHPPDALGGVQRQPSRADINLLNDIWERNPNGPRPSSEIIWGPGPDDVTQYYATGLDRISDPTRDGLKPGRTW